ncbi:nitrate ABC transporter substrate-binding protein [Gordonia sp. JH63]|uniref:Nitrate ABC transporter substrate-binding protein n=1 Tax=Gordonia hongkongensis TaxID=1701090 RepID=A0AAX3TBB2_9ACTN|nr:MULTISPECIES: nitrate ABC transporter substrate-binding protein [Gordonia]QHD85204.1 nitrate ABC transporter substrate-binding protein [Gordonia sp. JH63]QIK48853.1 nitrate ABC transporter substrate-binding protein [Gordonia terrae]UPG69647.1 nitrate ABC transporter substrate-binding protein [Gordonia hongkongensis]WFP26245.1 nitrate ABC transporter substrate-binding protein [Gordonia hongkongensis]
MTRLRTSRLAVAATAATICAAVLAGCSSSGSDDTASSSLPSAPAESTLAGTCPDNVVVQLQWQPQSDMAGVIGLLGPGYTVDTDNKSVSGPLVFDGMDTGVDITLRAGGPAIGFQSVPSAMYSDDSIHLGLVHGDQMISAAKDQRVVGVTPLLQYNPSIIMWDPATHPDVKTIADIGRSDASVVVSKDQIFPQWLVAKGLLQQDQLDTSYDGAPARFVGDPSITQQGFANSEPYTYENETPSWNKPVAYAMVKDAGYDVYASNVSVRAGDVEEMSPCLEKLVPMIQQTGKDYVASPDAVNATIVDWVSQDVSFTPYSAGEAAYSAGLLKDRAVIAPGADGVYGSYDMVKAQNVINDLVPILNGGGADLPAALPADQLFTTQFIDEQIR